MDLDWREELKPETNRHIAALLGNGVSVAFNPELALSKVNEELRDRLNRDVDKGDPASVLTDAANRIDTGDPYEDFEALLGPLDQQYDFINMMAEYARIIGPGNKGAHQNLLGSADFVRGVRRSGTSFALEIIDERSYAHLDEMEKGMHKLMDSLVHASDGGGLTLANLNYDNLAMASLTHSHSDTFCDMASGYPAPSSYEVIEGVEWEGRSLRHKADFPRPTRLLHLHGSLTWLRSPCGNVYRFGTNDLRSGQFWEKWRSGKTNWHPVVVLTNQTSKTELVKEWPFSMAYSESEESLTSAGRWLIAGYSFRDQSVNKMLARAWTNRKSPPEVLVITYGDDLSDGEIYQGLGCPWQLDTVSDSVHILRDGLPAALDAHEWGSWATN